MCTCKETDHDRSADDGLRSIQRDDVINDRRVNLAVRHDNITEVTDMSEQTHHTTQLEFDSVATCSSPGLL